MISNNINLINTNEIYNFQNDSKKNLEELLEIARDKNPNKGLINFSESYINLKADEIPEAVRWQILHASSAYKDEEGNICLGKNFGFDHLNEENLFFLYTLIINYHNYNGNKTIFNNHLNQMDDYFCYLTKQNPAKGQIILGKLIHSPLPFYRNIYKNIIDRLEILNRIKVSPLIEDVMTNIYSFLDWKTLSSLEQSTKKIGLSVNNYKKIITTKLNILLYIGDKLSAPFQLQVSNVLCHKYSDNFKFLFNEPTLNDCLEKNPNFKDKLFKQVSCLDLNWEILDSTTYNQIIEIFLTHAADNQLHDFVKNVVCRTLVDLHSEVENSDGEVMEVFEEFEYPTFNYLFLQKLNEILQDRLIKLSLKATIASAFWNCCRNLEDKTISIDDKIISLPSSKILQNLDSFYYKSSDLPIWYQISLGNKENKMVKTIKMCLALKTIENTMKEMNLTELNIGNLKINLKLSNLNKNE